MLTWPTFEHTFPIKYGDLHSMPYFNDKPIIVHWKNNCCLQPILAPKKCRLQKQISCKNWLQTTILLFKVFSSESQDQIDWVEFIFDVTNIIMLYCQYSWNCQIIAKLKWEENNNSFTFQQLLRGCPIWCFYAQEILEFHIFDKR
jgi:hypothetical protein